MMHFFNHLGFYLLYFPHNCFSVSGLKFSFSFLYSYSLPNLNTRVMFLQNVTLFLLTLGLSNARSGEEETVEE